MTIMMMMMETKQIDGHHFEDVSKAAHCNVSRSKNLSAAADFCCIWPHLAAGPAADAGQLRYVTEPVR